MNKDEEFKEWLVLRDNSINEFSEKLCYCGHTDKCTCADPDKTLFKSSVERGAITLNDPNNGWKNVDFDEKDQIHNMASCMLSILDNLKLIDNDNKLPDDETLSEIMFRKMKGYDIDLNKLLGFDHLEPVTKK